MARTSDKEIITKLIKMKKNAKQSGHFKVAAKIEVRINDFYKIKKQKSLLEWK